MECVMRYYVIAKAAIEAIALQRYVISDKYDRSAQGTFAYIG